MGSISGKVPDIDTKLGPLFRALIEGARLGGALLHSDVYRLTFSPSATQALADGSLARIVTENGLRSWVIDTSSGRIVEHGLLKAHSFVNGVTVPGAGWQIMAMITAQKYLADISRQLAAIKADLEALRLHLDEAREGKLIGNLQYLKNHADVIGSKLLSYHEVNPISNSIESIERESGQIAETLKREIQNHVAAFESNSVEHNLRGRLKEKSKSALVSFEDSLDRCSRSLTAALLARIIGAEQQLILDPTSTLAATRSEHLAHEINHCEQVLKSAWTAMINKLQNSRRTLEKEKNRAMRARKEAESGIGKWLHGVALEHAQHGISEVVNFETSAANHVNTTSVSFGELRQALESTRSLVCNNHPTKGKGKGSVFIVSIVGAKLTVIEAGQT